jgi:hypothetical protein
MHSFLALAMVLALSQPQTHLAVTPWTGTDLQTTTEHAAKYRLDVSGKPNASLRLRASGVAPGWLAAFCTPKFCAPQKVSIDLPKSGRAMFQFELIRESDTAPKQSGATIVAGDGSFVTVPAAYRQ